MLLSCSLDGSVKVWDVESGGCVRAIECDAPVTCGLFHPFNNNLIFVRRERSVHDFMVTSQQAGISSSSALLVLNLSTGQRIQEARCAASVSAVAVNPQGSEVFAGDMEV